MKTKNFLKNKKAQEGDSSGFSFVALLIIGLALLLVIMVFFKNFQNDALSVKEKLCRADIKAHSSITKWSAGLLTSDIQCEPEFLEIDPKDSTAKKEVAEAMKFCWDRWQKGNLQLFPDDPENKNEDEDGEGVYCNPCAFIYFEGSEPIEGFTNYLVTEKPKGSDQTYYEYLNSFYTEKELELNPDYEDKLLTDDDYVVLYLHAKGENSMMKIAEAMNSQYKAQAVKSMVKGSLEGAAVGGGVAAAGVVGTGVVATLVTGSAIVTGGISLVVIGIGLGIGALIGASSTDVEVPEWASIVVLDKVSSETFKNLGCQYSHQGKENVITDV